MMGTYKYNSKMEVLLNINVGGTFKKLSYIKISRQSSSNEIQSACRSNRQRTIPIDLLVIRFC